MQFFGTRLFEPLRSGGVHCRSIGSATGAQRVPAQRKSVSEPKRKQIEIQEVQKDEHRVAYRRPQTQAHRLSISVRTPSGADYPGTFQDLSIGGASAKFSINEAALAPGQIVLLTIGSLTRTAKVIAQARVMFCTDSPGGRHCGFQFTEPAKLLPQIDGFYGRFFNRRRSIRVGVPLDKRIPVSLFLTGSVIKTELVDLSADGMQVRTTRALSKELDGANHTFFSFKLPGQNAEFKGRAAILRRNQSRDVVMLGLAFDLNQENGIAKDLAALKSWIVHRANEISKWDSTLSKPDAA